MLSKSATSSSTSEPLARDLITLEDYQVTINDGASQSVIKLAERVFANSSGLTVTELTGGITNALLLGHYQDKSNGDDFFFLVRAYGKGTSAIIDRTREYATHMVLHQHSLAPPLYARFSNGIVYGFVPGRPTKYTELSHPTLSKGIAKKLGQWHAQIDHRQIEAHMQRSMSGGLDTPQDIWEVLSSWIEIMPEDTISVSREELRQELKWIKNEIGTAGGPTVVAHCDLLAGNIIVPESWTTESDEIPPVTIIDYEYSIPAPRAFDLANHFAEWQGFDCRKDLIPEISTTNQVIRRWLSTYLQSYSQHSRQCLDSEQEVDSLIGEVQEWWGMPGFYWGIWAVIQSKISEIDFDYVSYSKERLSEYYDWKEKRSSRVDQS